MVFIANTAVVSDSISEESTVFILSKLERKDIIVLKHKRDAICTVMNACDVIVCLPVGYGNSLIFESIPWRHEFLQGLEEVSDAVFSVTIISLLVSLMEKQVKELLNLHYFYQATTHGNDCIYLMKETNTIQLLWHTCQPIVAAFSHGPSASRSFVYYFTLSLCRKWKV